MFEETEGSCSLVILTLDDDTRKLQLWNMTIWNIEHGTRVIMLSNILLFSSEHWLFQML